MSKRITANRWEKILQDWKESGESKASFCRRNNISLSTLSYHVKREKNKESVSGFTRIPVLPIVNKKEIEKKQLIEIRTGYCTIFLGGNNIEDSLHAVLKTLKALKAYDI